MSEQRSGPAPVSTARSGPQPNKIDDDRTPRGTVIYFVVVCVPWIIMALVVALVIFGKHHVPCGVDCGG